MQKLDWVARPATVEEFYLQYRGRVEASVRRQGIVEWEDVASDILCRFIERDFLNKFDPDYTSVHDGVTYHAKFSRFVDGFVKTYCRGHRDRERRRFRREALVLDAPMSSDNEVPQADLLSIDFECEIEGYSAVVAVLEEIFELVDALPTTARRDLGVFSRAMVEQFLVDEYESMDRQALADEMQVSVSTVGNWLQTVRDEVAVCADQLR
jgi:hypothetical protein